MEVDEGDTFNPRFEVQLTHNFGYVSCFENAEEVIKQYETHTGFTFQVHKTEEIALEGSSHTVCWEALYNSSTPIPEACLRYDGIPYVNVRNKTFKCLCRGTEPDGENGKSIKTDEQIPAKETTRHQEKLGAKKRDCPAILMIQEVIKYPEYKIDVDTEQNRMAVSELLTVLLDGPNPPTGQRRFYINLPKKDDHNDTHGTNQEAPTTNPTECVTNTAGIEMDEPPNYVVMELVDAAEMEADDATVHSVMQLNTDVEPSDATSEQEAVVHVTSQQVVYACKHCPTYSTSYTEMAAHCKQVGIIDGIRTLTPLSNSGALNVQPDAASQPTKKRGISRKRPVNSSPHLIQTAAVVGIGDDSIPIMTLVNTPVPPEPEIVTEKPRRRPGRPRKSEQAPPSLSLKEEKKKEADEKHSHWDEANLKCRNCKMKFSRLRQLHSHRCLIDVLAKVIQDDSEEEDSSEEDYETAASPLDVKRALEKTSKSSFLKLDVPEEEKVKIEQTIFEHEIPQSMNDKAPSHPSKFTQNSLKVYTCPYCKKFFKHKQGMIHHIRSHTNYKPFKCSMCDFASITKGNLKIHERKHTGERFKCSQCKFSTISKGHLSVHANVHKKVQTRCELCNKNVYTPTNLLRHLAASHNIETSGKAHDYYEKMRLQTREGKRSVLFQCNVCNRKFKSKREHDSHLLLHTEEKPFVCSLCHYKTVRELYLDRHLRRHRLVYLCSLCNAKHLSMQLLKEHIAGHVIEEQVDRAQYDQQVYINSINCSIYMAEILDKELESARLNKMTDQGLEPAIVDFMQGTLQQSVALGVGATNGGNRSEFGGESLSKEELKDLLGLGHCKLLYKRLNVETLKAILKLYGEHECKPCGKLFMFKTHHDNHAKTHLVIKEFKCPHDDCEYSSHSPEGLKSHMEITHSGIQYKCAECGFETRSKMYLQKHMMKRHGAPDAYKCSRCDVAYGSEKEMKEHITEDHPSMLQEELEKIIGRRTHIYRKQGKEWFQCKHCPLKFRKIAELRQHMWQHEGLTPYKCEICGHGTRLLSNLKAHMLRHSDIKTHLCDECGKSFKTKNSLKVHHLSQHLLPSQDKSDRDKFKILLKCYYCDFACVQRSQLKKHLDIHTGDRQYKCGVCIQHFTNTKGGLRSHYSKHHPEILLDESLFLNDTEEGEEMMVEPQQTLTQYKCTQCHTLYDSYPSLEEHFQMEHNVDIARSGEEAAASVLIQAAALAEGAVEASQDETIGNTSEGLQIKIPVPEGNGAAELLQQIISMQSLGQLPSGSNQVQIELPAISHVTPTTGLVENTIYNITSSNQAQPNTSVPIQNFAITSQDSNMVPSQTAQGAEDDTVASIMQVQLQVTETGEQYYVTTGEGNGDVQQQVVVINEAADGEQEAYMEMVPDVQQQAEIEIPVTAQSEDVGDQQVIQAISDVTSQQEVTINAV